VCAALQATA